MGDWYRPWIEDDLTPEEAESFRTLTQRARQAVNNALKSPGVPLIVAHGALFRGLRHAMDLPVDVRLPNAAPVALKYTPAGWQADMLEGSISEAGSLPHQADAPLEYKSR